MKDVQLKITKIVTVPRLDNTRQTNASRTEAEWHDLDLKKDPYAHIQRDTNRETHT